jgi:hypothetical protein
MKKISFRLNAKMTAEIEYRGGHTVVNFRAEPRFAVAGRLYSGISNAILASISGIPATIFPHPALSRLQDKKSVENAFRRGNISQLYPADDKSHFPKMQKIKRRNGGQCIILPLH